MRFTNKIYKELQSFRAEVDKFFSLRFRDMGKTQGRVTRHPTSLDWLNILIFY